MKTRCPQCQTIYEITAAQITQRDGRVRCGQCQVLFNAISEMVPEDDVPVLTSVVSDRTINYGAVSSTAEGARVVQSRISQTPPHSEEDIVIADLNSAGNLKEKPIIDDKEPLDYHQHPPIHLDSGSQHAVNKKPMVVEPDNYYDCDAMDTDEKAYSGMFWFLMAVIMAIVLLVQSLVVFRNQIANIAPALRPTIVQVCALFGCEVGINKSVDNLSLSKVSFTPISTSEGNNKEQTYQLQFTLSNISQHTVTWPSLVFTLRDNQKTILIQRIITPKDYILPEQLVRPLLSGQQLTIRLPMSFSNQGAYDYTLTLYYP